MLEGIQKILTKNNASFKIVMSQNYDQEKLDPFDQAYLNKLYGTANVFDFSGINSFTNNVDNYYETAH